jgi:formylglycine-generating enzyme required for sulfatase activity
VSIFAGQRRQSGSADGPAAEARFAKTRGIAVGPDGSIYLADEGNNNIRKITPDGTVSTVAGSPEHLAGAKDGPGSEATFAAPHAVAVDAQGNVFVADTDNKTIRKISPPNIVTTYAGKAGEGGEVDGPGDKARFNAPRSVAVDRAGNLYVTDSDNAELGSSFAVIRKITPDGVVSTVYGTPVAAPAAPAPVSGNRPLSPGHVQAFIVQGDVQLIDEAGQATPLERGHVFEEGSTIKVGADGQTLVVFSNGVTLKILENSTLKVTLFRQAPFNQEAEGTFLRLSRDPSRSNTILELKAGHIQGEVKRLNQVMDSTFIINTPKGTVKEYGAFNINTDDASVPTPASAAASVPTAAQQAILKGPLAAFVSQLAKDTGIQLVPIPAGTFMMGSSTDEISRIQVTYTQATGASTVHEAPQTKVTLSKDFFLAATDVTQSQCVAVMGKNPSFFTQAGNDAPVETLSWDDAMTFCNNLTDAERTAGHLPDGYSFSLPTEAQWEYACRAGTTGLYAGETDKMAWYKDNSGSTTHPVATKQPNAWGLYDMNGDVSQWCLDNWTYRLPGGVVTDPLLGPKGSGTHVFRGGSWATDLVECRSASRFYDGGVAGRHGIRSFIGFRVALVQSKV